MTNILLKIVRICHSQFKCNYLKNEMLFLNSFFHFWNLHQILNVLKKKIIVIGNVFAKLETVKNFVRPLSKKRRFRTSFDSQHVKVSLIFATSAWEHFYHVFSSLWGKLIWKRSPIVIPEMLGVFANTFTADDKYSDQDFDYFATLNSNTILSKTKIFLKLFVQFLESTSNFKQFDKKDNRCS